MHHTPVHKSKSLVGIPLTESPSHKDEAEEIDCNSDGNIIMVVPLTSYP